VELRVVNRPAFVLLKTDKLVRYLATSFHPKRLCSLQWRAEITVSGDLRGSDGDVFESVRTKLRKIHGINLS